MVESVKAPLELRYLYGERFALVDFQTNDRRLAVWITGDKIDK